MYINTYLYSRWTSLSYRRFSRRSGAGSRGPGLAGGGVRSSVSSRRRRRQRQNSSTWAGCSTRPWRSGRTEAARWETGEAAESCWQVVELTARHKHLWMCEFCCFRRNREQQACRLGETRCMRWALGKWKQVSLWYLFCSHHKISAHLLFRLQVKGDLEWKNTFIWC